MKLYCGQCHVYLVFTCNLQACNIFRMDVKKKTKKKSVMSVLSELIILPFIKPGSKGEKSDIIRITNWYLRLSYIIKLCTSWLPGWIE